MEGFRIFLLLFFLKVYINRLKISSNLLVCLKNNRSRNKDEREENRVKKDRPKQTTANIK